MDLPRIYSLSSPEKHELPARDYLLNNRPDAVINILDASVLSRSLELTIELLDMGLPLVVCLNMMDEAARKGVNIDVEHLANDLGVPVIQAISTRGQGIPELFEATLDVARNGSRGKTFSLSRDVEATVTELISLLTGIRGSATVPPRLFALQLMQEDAEFEALLGKLEPRLLSEVDRLRTTISETHGRPSDMVISSERHSLAMNLFEHVAVVKPRGKPTIQERMDRYIMHPFWGYAILGLVLLLFFSLVFTFGKIAEAPLMGWFQDLRLLLDEQVSGNTLFSTILTGFIEGFSGGIGIGKMGMGIALVLNTAVGTVIALLSRLAFRLF